MTKLRKLKIKNFDLYLLILPVLLYYLIFWFIPLYGIQIGFKNYNPGLGFWDSPWTGFDHFIRFFKSFYFKRTITNTLGINFYGLLIGTPAPIILAIMFNELRSKRFQNFAQIMSYAPSFLSVTVVVGMLFTFLSPSTGFVNNIIGIFGMDPIDFMTNPEYSWHIYVWSNIWQGVGMSTIFYTAAISTIPRHLYEAAIVDGASRFQRIRFITLPSITPLIITLLLLAIGRIMSFEFEKIFLMQRTLNLQATEVISTYVYKNGILRPGGWSYTTAIGLFNSTINIIILWTANFVSKKTMKVSLW